MAIPNTSSGWSLDTSRAQLGQSTTTSLAACIAAGNSQGGWDPAYSGSKNSLLNFRNYGGAGTVSVSPTSISFGQGTPSSNVDVISNTTWTVTDNMTWITVSPTDGSDFGNFTVAVNSTNPSSFSRSGTVTVTALGGQTATISVSQVGTTTGGGGGGGGGGRK